jgi:hypothetical protein
MQVQPKKLQLLPQIRQSQPQLVASLKAHLKVKMTMETTTKMTKQELT